MQASTECRSADVTSGAAVKQLMVATGLTQHSNRTLEYAEAIARLYTARILLLNVVDPAFFWAFPLEGMPDEPGHIHEQLSSQLSNMASNLRAKGIDCKAILREGNIRSEIRATINQENVDLVILGAHRKGSLRQLVFGSTFNTIIHETACPVITIGPNVLPISGSEAYRFDQILLSADFSAASRLAASYAVALTKEHGSKLIVAYVRTRGGRSCDEQRLKRSLRELVPELNNFEFSAVVLDGDPVHALSNQCRTKHTDLIVMGLRRASRAATMLGEATAHEVICRADCPVFTIAQQEHAHAGRPAFIEELAGTVI